MSRRYNNNSNWYNFQQPMESFPTGNRGYNAWGNNRDPPPLMSNIIVPHFPLNNGFAKRNNQVNNWNRRNFNFCQRSKPPSHKKRERDRRAKKRKREAEKTIIPRKKAKEQTSDDIVDLLSDEESSESTSEDESWLNRLESTNRDVNNKFSDFLNNLIKNIEEPYLSNIKKIDLLIESLSRALNNRNTKYTFVPFGSSMTGLAFRTSDIDLCIQRDGTEDDVYSLKALSRKLSAIKNIFSKVTHIKAKVPIVRFMHLPTMKYCDISTERGSHENTKLVQYFLSYDPRIKPIMMYLKHWFKSHLIHGTGKFTTYNLVWITVFYLQQLKPPLVPTVSQLQNSAHENVVNGWDCGFDESFIANLPQNDIGLFDIMAGFFRYYANFNFRKNAICPYVGYPLSTRSLNDPHALPECYKNYSMRLQSNELPFLYKDHFICVQDPFQHNSNIAKQVAYPIFENFRSYCHAVVRLADRGCDDFDQFITANGQRNVKITFHDSKATIVFRKKSLPISVQVMEMADRYRIIIKAVCYIIKHVFLATEPSDGYTTFVHRTDDLILPIQFTISLNNKVLINRNEIARRVTGHKLKNNLDDEMKKSNICSNRMDVLREYIEAIFSFDVTEETESVTLSVEGNTEICNYLQVRAHTLVNEAISKIHP